jgi:hypothetical protein
MGEVLFGGASPIRVEVHVVPVVFEVSKTTESLPAIPRSPIVAFREAFAGGSSTGAVPRKEPWGVLIRAKPFEVPRTRERLAGAEVTMTSWPKPCAICGESPGVLTANDQVVPLLFEIHREVLPLKDRAMAQSEELIDKASPVTGAETAMTPACCPARVRFSGGDHAKAIEGGAHEPDEEFLPPLPFPPPWPPPWVWFAQELPSCISRANSSEYCPVRNFGVATPFAVEITKRCNTGTPPSTVETICGKERFPPGVRFMGAG